jgi:hypothetical protein
MMAFGVLERRPGHINIREARRNHLPANRSLTLAYTLSGVAAILLLSHQSLDSCSVSAVSIDPIRPRCPHCSARTR